MSKRKTRDRQLAKLAARRAAERRRRRRQRLIALGLGVLLIAGIAAGVTAIVLSRGGRKPVATPTSPRPGVSASPGSNCGYKATDTSGTDATPVPPPTFSIDVNKYFSASVQTSMGTFTIQLFARQAPCTVNSFIYLAQKGFYDGLTFHRIVRDFVIQGGDPLGTGAGGPGYQFNDELKNDLTYEIGSVAMANSGANTNGSQWFVVTGQDGVALPKSYTIFGKVTEGLPVPIQISQVETNGGTGPDAEQPVHEVTINKITISESAAPPSSPSPTATASGSSPKPTPSPSPSPTPEPTPTASASS
jgi:cyclophilin family peptidyl-prolyl cis-trans isomerase